MAQSSASELESQTIRRVYWRLIPILFVMMFFNYLDRINLGYAGLTMNKDLGLSPAIFGFAASTFFLGYINASLLPGAASIATVNTLAQFGGLIGPWCIGLIKDSTGSISWTLVGIAGFLVIAAAIAATMRVKPRETELTGVVPSSVAH